MAYQSLRRPVRTCQVYTPGHCPARVPGLTRFCSQTPNVVSPALCPSRAPVLGHLQQHASRSQVARRTAVESGVQEAFERKRSKLQIDNSPVLIDGPDVPELPMPSEYQQTLWSSFTLAGVGLHTGEYACVRVRPAFAGEGRYFVRVPDGTNTERAQAHLESLMGDPLEGAEGLRPEEEAALDDPEYRMELVTSYQAYIDAQEEEGFGGSFTDFLRAQDCTELIERLRTEGPPKLSYLNPEAPQPRSEDEPYISASIAAVYGPNPVHTCLANGDLQVLTVEALLSALEACGVDNARIEIEGGPELPVIDGSAEGWAREVFKSGLRYAPARPDLPVPGVEGLYDNADEDEQQAEAGEREEQEGGEGEGSAGPRPVPKLVLRPQKVISVVRGSSFVTLYPDDTFRFTAGLDRHQEAPVIGKQWLSWCMFEDVHYLYAIADSRPFVASPEQAMGMREAGWLLGGTEGVMIIGYGDKWYDQDVVRHMDEPVRHQIQDLIGDLSLLSRDGHSGLPLGHIVTYDADHALYGAFVEKLLEETTEEDWVPMRDITGPSVPLNYTDLLGSVVGEEDEDEGDEGGQHAYDGDEAEQQQEYEDEGEDEEGEYDEYEQGGEYEEEGEEEGVVDVEASDVDPPPRGSRGGGGGKGRR